MSDRDARSGTARATIRAAKWGAAATIIAAIIGFLGVHFGGSQPVQAGRDQINQVTGSNNAVNTGNGTQVMGNSAPVAVGSGAFSAQGNDSTFVQGSNNQIGVLDSEFHKKNGLQFGQSPPTVLRSKSLVVTAYNHSARRIDHAQILIFDRTSGTDSTPYLETREQSVNQSGRVGGPLPLKGVAPAKIQLCLSFESAQPNEFVIATVDMALEKDDSLRGMAKYIPTDDYKVFYSSKPRDCGAAAMLRPISNEQFFAKH